MEQIRIYLAPVYLGLLALLTVGLCLGLLVDLAATITREREQRTVESLLALPESRGRVLRTKFGGALYRRWRWLAAIAWVLCVALWIMPVLSVAMLTVLIAAQAAFVASLALLISLLARTTVRAYVLSLVLIAGLIVLTGVTARYRPRLHSSDSFNALNPIGAWQRASRGALDPAERYLDARVV